MISFAQKMRQTFVSFVKPEKEERIQHLVHLMKEGLRIERKNFELTKVLQGFDYKHDELSVAKKRVYESLLRKSWEDKTITDQERDIASWVANCIELSSDDIAKINHDFAIDTFSVVLAKAMEDGYLDNAELKHLEHIALSVGHPLPVYVRSFFKNEAESFLQWLFSSYIEDNELTPKEWGNLFIMGETLGIKREEILSAISKQATSFVERVLVEAKADDKLSSDEESSLVWLVENLDLSKDFRRYVKEEIRLLRLITNIYEGKLPTVNAKCDIELRAGEILHFQASAMWTQTKKLRSGLKIEKDDGDLFLTDNRMIFSSPHKPHSISYRRIVSHKGTQSKIEVLVEGKPLQVYHFSIPNQIGYPIFRTALALINQTMIAKTNEDVASRYIPRDVRQRTWQRYQGRCVDCGATDYLEFDHIIPVAKGGSNTDANIQLLCRRCNLKKSDNI